MVRHDRYSIVQVPEVVAKSGSFLIHFYSDVAYNMTGFNITFRYVYELLRYVFASPATPFVFKIELN